MRLGQIAVERAPLRARFGSPIREREVLRIAAHIDSFDVEAALECARREVLTWAQRRCDGHLPKRAWDGEGFDFSAAGRTMRAARLVHNAVDLWALRRDDPDTAVPTRMWTTEVVIGRLCAQTPHFSLRLLVAPPNEQPAFAPAVPCLIHRMINEYDLRAGRFAITDAPWSIASDMDAAELIALIESPERRLPVVVAAGDERTTNPDSPLIDADYLARATTGLAHIVVVPARFTYGLSDAFGRSRSCFHGAVRVYRSGFDSSADPYEHPLATGERVRRDPEAIVAGLRGFAARESLRRMRLGTDVLTFADVHSSLLPSRP